MVDLGDGPGLWEHCADLVARHDSLLDPVSITWLGDRRRLDRSIRRDRLLRRVDLAGLKERSVMRRDSFPLGTLARAGSWHVVLDAWFNWGPQAARPEWSEGGRVVMVDARRTRPQPHATLHWLEEGRQVVVVEVGREPVPPALAEVATGIPWEPPHRAGVWFTRRVTALAVASRLTGQPLTSDLLTARWPLVSLALPEHDKRPIAAVPGHPVTADPAIARIAANTTYDEATVREAAAILAGIGARSAGLESHPVVVAALDRLWLMTRAPGAVDAQAAAREVTTLLSGEDEQFVSGLARAFSANPYHALVGGRWSVRETRVVAPDSPDVTADEAVRAILGRWLYLVRDHGPYPV